MTEGQYFISRHDGSGFFGVCASLGADKLLGGHRDYESFGSNPSHWACFSRIIMGGVYGGPAHTHSILLFALFGSFSDGPFSFRPPRAPSWGGVKRSPWWEPSKCFALPSLLFYHGYCHSLIYFVHFFWFRVRSPSCLRKA